MEPTLALNAAVGSVASGCFLTMALRVRDTRVSDDARQAMTLFSVWWMALAIYAVAGASIDLAAAFGVETVEVVVAAEYMQAFALCIGLWGLMYYLAYILTGSKRILLPLAIFYSLYYATILFFVTTGRPIGVEVDAWRARLMYAQPIVDRLTATLLLVIPPLVGAGTYLAIYARTSDASARYRIAALTIATVVWCVSLVARESSLAAGLPAILALGAAFAARWAYAPPAFLKARMAA